MKKEEQDNTLFESDLNNTQNLYSEGFKTTNINILLNRVRLDKKKLIRKKIVISVIFVTIIIAITTYFII